MTLDEYLSESHDPIKSPRPRVYIDRSEFEIEFCNKSLQPDPLLRTFVIKIPKLEAKYLEWGYHELLPITYIAHVNDGRLYTNRTQKKPSVFNIKPLTENDTHNYKEQRDSVQG